MYNKTIWKDQDVERKRTYEFIKNSDGSYTVQDSFGLVGELGTPVNAKNMNNIENGIENHETRILKLENKTVKIGENASAPVGSSIRPIYVNSNGIVVNCAQNMDGVWNFMPSSTTVLTSKNAGTTSVNLTEQNILPDDSCYYDLSVSVYNHNKTSQVVAVDLYSDIMTTPVICARAAQTSEYSVDTFNIIVGPAHTLFKHQTYEISNAVYVMINAYKRLGQI